MYLTVSRAFGSSLEFLRAWLFCPEAISLFVSIFILFNVLRIVRGLFVCFCKWKFKEIPHKISVTNDSDKDNHIWKENAVFRNNSHEAKSCDMAAFSMQGRRKTMEDRFNYLAHNFEHNYSLYAVFDGHGGEVGC